jgi:SAM-dependent methyltransferase
MPVSRDEVIMAYNVFLDREPESESAIGAYMNSRNLDTLLQTFRDLLIKSRPAEAKPGRLPLDLPKIEVETDASAEQLAGSVARIKAAWTHLGVAKPHFSVLTDPRFLPENLDGSIELFFSTGEDEAAGIQRILERHGLVSLSAKTCVEYGCGVGRVTTGLARRFSKVHAYDISSEHLAYAQRRARETGVDNVVFHLCSENILEDIDQCDFFYSRIVFQHNPPVIITQLIKKALRGLNPNGIAIFQVPTYMAGYRFNTDKWLGARHALDMQMHCLPQARIFQIVAEEGCALLEVREDDSIGSPDTALSNTFVVRKRR